MDFFEATAALNGSLGSGVNWGQTPTLFLLDHLCWKILERIFGYFDCPASLPDFSCSCLRFTFGLSRKFWGQPHTFLHGRRRDRTPCLEGWHYDHCYAHRIRWQFCISRPCRHSVVDFLGLSSAMIVIIPQITSLRRLPEDISLAVV